MSCFQDLTCHPSDLQVPPLERVPPVEEIAIYSRTHSGSNTSLNFPNRSSALLYLSQYHFAMRTRQLTLFALPWHNVRIGSRLYHDFSSAYSSTLKMEVIVSSETSVYFYQTSRHYIPEDRKNSSYLPQWEPQIHQSYEIVSKEFSWSCVTLWMGRAIAQAVSRWLYHHNHPGQATISQSVAAVPSGPSWTPPPTKRIKIRFRLDLSDRLDWVNPSQTFHLKTEAGAVSETCFFFQIYYFGKT
jgi:hypothetical protein